MTRTRKRPPAVAAAAVTAVLGGLALLGVAAPASADPVCRAVEARFTPGAPNLQIVAWIEDIQGRFIDTIYITRLTGQFGLGNRPGEALLKTDFRWPYGRREMVFPVWAHRHGRQYPKILMGGVCGNSPTSRCPDGSYCAGDCEDSTIAYHARVSSYEPFYCSPSGASRIDAMSCASKGTFAKGAFADSPAFSRYPPRADLTNYVPSVDSPDVLKFAKANDLVAVSQATPPAGAPIAPILWYPKDFPDGDYVLWLEASQESDFNAHHNHPNKADSVKEWDFEGHGFLGQPSVIYRVPFRLDGGGFQGGSRDYAGYSTWDGTDGKLHPPDGTIETARAGSGAGRLMERDGARLAVRVGPCGGTTDGGVSDGGTTCDAPGPVGGVELKPEATAITVSWLGPTSGATPARYELRYQEGSTLITDEEFLTRLSPNDPPPSPAGPGVRVQTTLRGLMASTAYTIAVRAVSTCGAAGRVVSVSAVTPQQKYTTLSGCFVATAAWGSPEDGAVRTLRGLRDRHLLGSPAGQLFVAAYYAMSPSLARAIAGDEHLRGWARALLDPIVRWAELIE